MPRIFPVVKKSAAGGTTSGVPIIGLTEVGEKRSDLGIQTFTWRATPRSGTPDSDAWGDAWTDQSVGQTGVNHGAEATVFVQNFSGIERRGLLEVDLTRFTGLTASGNLHTFQIQGTFNNTVASGFTMFFGASTTRLFTESTVTWDNQPAIPGLFSRSFTLAANDPSLKTYTASLGNSEMSQLLGKWVLVVLQTTFGTAQFLASSRENALSQRPLLTFTVQR